MNNYRLTLLVKNELEDKERTALFDDVAKNVSKVTTQDLWGTRNLMYKIQKQDSAFYAHFEFESEPSTISVLDKKLKLNEDVIRFLLLRVEHKKARAKKIFKKVEEVEVKEEVKKVKAAK